MQSARRGGTLTNLRLKRAYEPAFPEDGVRILVDRLWPRGLARDKACIELWLKEVAPSDALRRWFGHQSARWAEFKRRYRQGLDENPAAVTRLRRMVDEYGCVTLLFAARDLDHNNAIVLREMLKEDTTHRTVRQFARAHSSDTRRTHEP
ncbi:MAG: DUF488 domain-containing protein [Methylocella sp.]